MRVGVSGGGIGLAPAGPGEAELGGAVQERLLALLRGGAEGEASTDPEARAFRIARERERGEQQRRAAERLGVSGFTGTGAFDVESGKIGEEAARDIAGFEARLAGRRRGERLAEQSSALNLALSSLGRQAAERQAAQQAALAERQAAFGERITGAESERAAQQARQAAQLAQLQALLSAQAPRMAAGQQSFENQLAAFQAAMGGVDARLRAALAAQR